MKQVSLKLLIIIINCTTFKLLPTYLALDNIVTKYDVCSNIDTCRNILLDYLTMIVFFFLIIRNLISTLSTIS